jgi:hypothetical protein
MLLVLLVLIVVLVHIIQMKFVINSTKNTATRVLEYFLYQHDVLSINFLVDCIVDDAMSSLCVVQGLCCVLIATVIQYICMQDVSFDKCRSSQRSTFNVNVPLLSLLALKCNVREASRSRNLLNLLGR